ncbi:efflux RND transporter permease subunit [Bermanella marisrubri]|uniref:Cation/multidrug efflux pump n=1 Tax=Bermanella marisrubri TaxID=207949 RepID=Q1MYE2_9GAMM|nr:efflux RND transporter permease subunit [Bermanella marisrubri]EAT11003.1 Cation/multidrug efflux pump [Oceanobacter sp. RED65] [Bermanella marisrubri]QIZ83752.1 efflux RND transporter permease subunit [Bermanella marisrubri]
MKVSQFFLRNHQFTWLLAIIFVLLGVVAYLTMPRAEDPQFDFPAVSVLVVNPGTTPKDMESLVVDPIEESINELEDIKFIKTNIEDGLARMQVEFLYGSDPDEKYDDVVTAINNVRDELPSSIAKLETKKISPSEVGILQYALSSRSSDYVELRRYGERLENALERLGGVKRVDLDAMADLEVQVSVNPGTMHALGLSLSQVKQAVESASYNIPGGHVHAGDRRFSVLTSGDFSSVEQLERVLIASVNGKNIYLDNIASIQLTDGLPSYRGYYQGETAVFLNVIQRQGTNIFNVVESIKGYVAEYETTLPNDLTLSLVNDQSTSVETRVNGFFSNLIQGLVLVAAACLWVLGRGPSVVVVLAIPISIFIAIGWLDFTGYALQQMSIVGLVIALGLLVDNAIVVVENILRLKRDGYSAQQASALGSDQVSMAIASGTLTTILSFVPMLLMQNGSGTFIRSMPVTVVLTLLASLLVALTLTPLIMKKVLSKQGDLNSVKTTKASDFLDGVAKGMYATKLKTALARPKTVIGIAIATFVFALMLFPFIGVSLFPKAEKPMILVNIELPEGASFYQTEQAAFDIEDQLAGYALIEDVVVNVGRGNPRIYYNVSPDRQTPNFAQLFVHLSKADLSEVEPFVEQLRKDLNRTAGVRVFVKEFHQGPPSEAPISIRVVGHDWQSVRQGAAQVESIMRNTQGTVNVDNPIGKEKLDLKLNINRDKAAMLGISLSQLDQDIRAALVGSYMGIYKDEQGDEYDIVLRSSESDRPLLSVFEQLKVTSGSGALVPLKQIANLQMQSGMARFQHHNTRRMARVTSDVKSGFNTAALTQEVLQQVGELNLPSGVSISVGGEQENREESFGGMAKALIIALLGIFAVLVIQFRSFMQPLIVFTAIPFAATGAFFALFLTGYTFSFTAFVGLTSLVGIVVNNAIILVDYANQEQANGANIHDAILKSAQTRMTPILLTTLTTIGGLLPLTLSGSSMWSPMGWAIIGGLVVSTLLTLFVVPVLYTLFTPKNKQVKDEADAKPISA